MIPVLTADQMKAVDAHAPVDEATLIGRAGFQVARVAKLMMAGTYGRRVAVVAGKGNNGADGRVAASRLRSQGVRVDVFEPNEHRHLLGYDLVIDAAFGTGFRGSYVAPSTGGAPVLAVDIPSGVDADTGAAQEGVVRADVTVTVGGLKPGLLINDGPGHAGKIHLAEIGLGDAVRQHATTYELEAHDVVALLPDQQRESHKWKAAVVIVAGSPGMMGAATFSARGAQRAGAGMVRLGSPGVSARDLPIGEAVALELPADGWADVVLEASGRTQSIVVGPGLGRSDQTVSAVLELIQQAELPVVIDGDGLFAVSSEEGRRVLRARKAPTVLTPHDGEFKRLSGHAPRPDRIGDVRSLAEDLNATVLLKGSTTTVSTAQGEVLLSTTGSSRLATAGTGDVLSGVIGTFLAMQLEPAMAAAAGAYVHGAAAQLGYAQGLVAGDLPELLAEWLSSTVS